MCEFVSWIEVVDGEEKMLLYLTAKDLRSSKGRKLKERIGDDINGHGAIREFYDLVSKYGIVDSKYGIDRECSDFSTPDNFPAEIVTAIKAGEFRGFGAPEELLCGTAWAEYSKVCGTALAECRKVCVPAWAEYSKVCGTALAEYRKVCGTARAEYSKVCDAAWAEYKKVRAPALAEYNKVRDPVLAEYNKVCDAAFWNLFADEENRSEAWRGK